MPIYTFPYGWNCAYLSLVGRVPLSRFKWNSIEFFPHLYNLNQSVYSLQHWNLYFMYMHLKTSFQFFIVSFSRRSFPFRSINIKSRNMLLFLHCIMQTVCVSVCLLLNANLLSEVNKVDRIEFVSKTLQTRRDMKFDWKQKCLFHRCLSECLCMHNMQLLFCVTSFTRSQANRISLFFCHAIRFPILRSNTHTHARTHSRDNWIFVSAFTLWI